MMEADNMAGPAGRGKGEPMALGAVRHSLEARELRPVLEAYARNLLATTSLGTARDQEGRNAALTQAWCRDAVHAFASTRSGGPTTPEQDLTALVDAYGGRPARVGFSPGRVGRNLGALARAFRLDRADRAVLQFKLALRLVPSFLGVTDLLGPVATGGAVELLAVATGERPSAMARALSPEGAAVRAGLLILGQGTLPIEQKLAVRGSLTDLLTTPRLTPGRLADAWFPRDPAPALVLPDYGHLEPSASRLLALLRAALGGGEAGVNVLLHGPTGCGKSEMARLLAREASAELRSAGAPDDEGQSPNPWERLRALVAAERILTGSRTILLFDEREDILCHGRMHASVLASKAWFRRLLEINPVPTIWITSDPASLDPAVHRRFAMAVELPRLDEQGRRLLWAREAGGALAPGEVARLAARFPVSAAQVSGAMRTSRLIGGGRVTAAVAEAVLEGSIRAMAGRTAPRGRPQPFAYDATLLNASVNLQDLSARIRRRRAAGGCGVTICLHGPPGTGKSEWVRHLSGTLGAPLHAHQGSGILSRWVGEAEKNLATAFAEAERAGAVLLFDEADSFLLDRQRASWRWEVTLTNEFLQHLEEARGVVACTTNSLQSLDPAVLRRFTFRIACDYLRPEQAAQLFAREFEPYLAASPDRQPPDLVRRLAALGPLAPGDFAAVARRVDMMGDQVTAVQLLEELATEVAARGKPARAVGFRDL